MNSSRGIDLMVSDCDGDLVDHSDYNRVNGGVFIVDDLLNGVTFLGNHYDVAGAGRDIIDGDYVFVVNEFAIEADLADQQQFLSLQFLVFHRRDDIAVHFGEEHFIGTLWVPL